MIIFWFIPIDALRRDFVEAGGVFLDPCLEAEWTVTHRSNRYKPSWFKFVFWTTEGVTADVYFSFWEVYVSHILPEIED